MSVSVIPNGRARAYKRDRTTLAIRHGLVRECNSGMHSGNRSPQTDISVFTTLLMLHELRKIPLSCAFRARVRDDTFVVM